MSATLTRQGGKNQADALLDWTSKAFREAGFVDKASASEGNLGVVEGIILAGVHAWGNSALDRVACWPLVPVAGKPLVTHALKWLADAGIRTVSICANSDTVHVARVLGDGRDHGVTLEYYEDRFPRGPAGCVRDVISDRKASVFVVVDGSVLPQIDLGALLEAHKVSGASLTLAAADATGGIGSQRKLFPVGIYVCSESIVQHIDGVGYQDVKERLLPTLHAKGVRVQTHMVESGVLPRVRCAASYLTLNRWAMERVGANGELGPDYRSEGASRVHTTARIDAGARLVGPVLVGPKCVVEAGAVIVGPTTIGAGCQVGRDAVVARSAIWSSCKIGAGSTVDDCVLADHAVIGDGVVRRNAVCVAPGR